MQHELKGSMVLSVQRTLINSFPLMSKGEETLQRASIRQSEEEFFHQCQRGRLLEIFSLMEKEVAKEVAKELASDTVTRNREKKHSRRKRSADKAV